MTPATEPADEAVRLATLCELRLLDTPREERFDRITRLAAHTLGVPIALLTLVDSRRQWFKSAIGIALAEMPREVSICSHALLGSGTLVVPDASADPRFADYPGVCGEPGVRFYAGRPLRAPNGATVGVLCVIDLRPREFSAADAAALEDLAAIAEAELSGLERKAAEAALRESETRLRRLAEEQSILLSQTRDFVYRHDAAGVFTYLSPAVEQITGRTTEDWLRHYSSYLTDHPTNANVVAYTEETMRTGKQSPPYLVEVFHRDGHRVMLEVHERAYLEKGTIAGIIGVARDITERHRAQEALRESEERYADLVRESPDPILRLDPGGRITAFNPAAERLSGLGAAEVHGFAFASIVLDAESAAQAQAELARVLAGEDRPLFEVDWLTRGQGRRMLEANAHAIRHGSETVGLQVTLRDVTERKRTEQRKDEFISTVSHELRTPLTSILGSLGLLAGGAAGGLPEASLKLVSIARRNGERLLRLINDILDLDRLKSGKIDLRPRTLEIAQVIEQAVESDRAFAERYGVAFEVDRPLPAARVQAAPDRLAKVFSNLLSHAVKFSPALQPVRISATCDDGWVRIAIRDHGPGIAEDFRPRVFERFAQADTSDMRPRGGTGLGLSIAKGMVDRMGGRLAFESRPGEGTTFLVELPEFRDDRAEGPG